MRVIRLQMLILEMNGGHPLRVLRLRAVRAQNPVSVDKAGSIKSFKPSLAMTFQGRMDRTRACPAMQKRQGRTLLLEVIEIETIHLPRITHKGKIRQHRQDQGRLFRLVMLCHFYTKTHRSVNFFDPLQHLQWFLVEKDRHCKFIEMDCLRQFYGRRSC